MFAVLDDCAISLLTDLLSLLEHDGSIKKGREQQEKNREEICGGGLRKPKTALGGYNYYIS